MHLSNSLSMIKDKAVSPTKEEEEDPYPSDNVNLNDEIFDIIGYLSDHEKPLSDLPKTPVVCKPSETAIVKALAIANVDPKKPLFFDDSVRNIQAGKRVGLNTVLVGTSQKVKCADYAIENIHNLKEALPELWESEAKPGKVRYSGKLPVETPVVA
ncbi:unnamed protein product [Microthlaspi erraticum]|uniref:Uncharacterized protein n=1 Tax=Microthlaspi erraticum TaxID=1685480 RepID=A0A6D2L200_9BRAS|nr:unnamed protein product [Microthlaspi erraticum]